MKYTPDYSSRFRILKGGKISLVVSALLVSSSIVGTNVNAANFNIANASLTANLLGDGDTVVTTEDIIANAPVSVAANGYAADISINHNVTITDAGADDALLLIGLGNGTTASTFTIAEEKTVSLTETDSIVGKTVEFVNGVTNTTVTNSGTISTSITNVAQTGNAYVSSLIFDGDADTVSVTNSGTINTSFTDPLLNSYSGYVTGIEFYSVNNAVMKDITITNSGSIDMQVNNTNVGYGAGASGYGISMYAYSGNNDIDASNISITNSDTLSVTTTNTGDRDAHAKGIDIKVSTNYDNVNNYYNATISNMSISNSGQILVSTVGSGNAFGINIETDSYYGDNSVVDATITNAGTITVNGAREANGIKIDSGDIIGLTLTNQAGKSIIANGVYNTSAINLTDITDSTITNSGTLSASVTSDDDYDARTLRVGDVYGTSHILNETTGTITANAEDVSSSATAIRTSSLYDTSIVENRGTITALAGGNSKGIVTSDVYSDAQILNSGTINVTSQGLFAYGSRATGIYVDGDLNGEVTNSHTINVTALDGGTGKFYSVIARGIDIESDVDGGQITNSGTITVTAAQNTDAYYDLEAKGINVDGDLSNGATITNTSDGIIRVTHNDADGDATGIAVDTMEDTSSISNAGMIEVQAGYNAYGIFVDGMDEDSGDGLATISNSGTITVNALNGQSHGIHVDYTDYVASPFAITNSGTITATVNDEADANGYAVSSSSMTMLHVTNTSTGKMYGNISLSPYSTLTNAGTISLPHNAMDGDSASVGTFVNTATGKLEIGLLTDGTTTTHSQLETSDATFEDGSTIKVNVLAASTNVTLLAGTTLEDVVSASNDLTINGTLNITDNSALLNFEYVEDGETIDLNVVEGTTIFDSTVSGGGTGNAQSAASALQTIQDNGIPAGMTGFFTALNTLTTDAEVAAAVESTTPATVGATATANSQIMNGIQGIVEMRQNNVLGGMNSGDMSFTDKNLWAKVYGSRGSQDDKNGVRGFDVNAFGLGIGADAEIAPRTRIGAALFYTDADVDVNAVNQRSDVKVYTALVYGNTPVAPNTDFLYQAGYSWQKTESDRNVLGIGNVSSDYTAKTASLDLKLMQTYKMDNAFTLRPLIETTYRHYSSPSYSESTGGLDVEKFTSTQLIMGAGVIAEYKTSKTDKLIADISLGYDLHHDAEAVTASFQGTSTTFETRGIDNGGWQYDIGLGYETANILGGELNFMYNYQAQGSSFDNHVLSAKYVWKF